MVVLNVAHINRPNNQYCSNVAMKVHAKLGGTVCQVGKPVEHKSSTLWIGADVSHASPGSQQASMAAMTMSTDLRGIRFAAHVETNGRRVEMIQKDNVIKFFRKHLPQWSQKLNQGKRKSFISSTIMTSIELTRYSTCSHILLPRWSLRGSVYTRA